MVRQAFERVALPGLMLGDVQAGEPRTHPMLGHYYMVCISAIDRCFVAGNDYVLVHDQSMASITHSVPVLIGFNDARVKDLLGLIVFEIAMVADARRKTFLAARASVENGEPDDDDDGA